VIWKVKRGGIGECARGTEKGRRRTLGGVNELGLLGKAGAGIKGCGEELFREGVPKCKKNRRWRVTGAAVA